MPEVKKVLDFSNVVTKDALSLISVENYLEIVAEGKKEGSILERTYTPQILIERKNSKPLEIANFRAAHHNKNDAEKMILASEITFFNQLEKIIDILVGMDLTYTRLYFICRYITKVNQGEKREEEIEKLCFGICRLFSLHFGITNSAIILTKLNSILCYNKCDYKKIEEKHRLNKLKLKALEEKQMQTIIEEEKQR